LTQMARVTFITLALKMHAIKHQRPGISIRLGDQDHQFLARTKDLRALLVATSNLNPAHCTPAISAYLPVEGNHGVAVGQYHGSLAMGSSAEHALRTGGLEMRVVLWLVACGLGLGD
jgi:hypothetical protein